MGRWQSFSCCSEDAGSHSIRGTNFNTINLPARTRVWLLPEIEQRILNEMDTSFIELTGREPKAKDGRNGTSKGSAVRKRKRITLLL